MNKATRHRGPDATGVYVGGVSLGHARLKVVDLDDRANQPMHSKSGRYTLVYNGELYNTSELRARIGGSWQTCSDTEVLLAAFEKWGPACVEYFNGMYAFAVWDSTFSKLYVARDPRGIKPLYYTVQDGVFVFSSELRGLYAYGVIPQLDHEMVGHYFRLLYTPGPKTLLKGVYKLLPGAVGIWDGKTFTVERHTNKVSCMLPAATYEARLEQVLNVLAGAVERQLAADVPVGIYLSGGLDSTILLDRAVAAGAMPHTFSTAFEVPQNQEAEKFNYDADIARRTAAQYGVPHHRYTLSVSDIYAALEPSLIALEEPNANPTYVPMYILAAHARREVTVALNGTGGDELFGGYPRYQQSRKLSLLGPLLYCAQYVHPKITLRGLDRYAGYMFQKDHELQGVPVSKNTRELFRQYLAPTCTPEEELMRIDQDTWLVDDALLREDKMSMAHGLEARVPFLDEEVVGYAHALSQRDKLAHNTTKRLLRDAFRDVLPSEVIQAPKRGWFTPSAKWLRDPRIHAWARETLSSSYYQETSNLFDFEVLRDCLAAHVSGRAYHRTLLWSVLSFQVWARHVGVRL